jgi:hypothetical protein
MLEEYINNPNINNSVRTVLYAINEGCKWFKSLFAPKLYANFYFVKGNDEVDDGVLHDAKYAASIKATAEELEFQEEMIGAQDEANSDEDSESSGDDLDESWDMEGTYHAPDPYLKALKAGINPLANMIGHHHTEQCVSGGCTHKSVLELVGHHANLIETASQ